MTLERALEIVAEKKIADANKLVKHFEGTDVEILNGRWGAYITDGNKNAKIPKELKEKPAEIPLETCLKLLEEAPERRGRGKKKAAAKKEADASKKKAALKRKRKRKLLQRRRRKRPRLRRKPLQENDFKTSSAATSKKTAAKKVTTATKD